MLSQLKGAYAINRGFVCSLHQFFPLGGLWSVLLSSMAMVIAVPACSHDVGCSVGAANTFGAQMLCGAAIGVMLLLGRNHWLVAVEAEALLGLEGGMTVFGDTRAHMNLQ